MDNLKFGLYVNLLINIVMGIALGITGQVINNDYSIIGFIQGFIISMGIGFFIGTWVPIIKIGKWFANILKCRESSIAEYIISTFAIAIVMIFLISITCIFAQAGELFFQVYFHLIIPFLFVGVIVIECSLWLIIKIVKTF